MIIDEQTLAEWRAKWASNGYGLYGFGLMFPDLADTIEALWKENTQLKKENEMARNRPFRRVEINSEICAKIAQIIGEKRYRGSFTSFIETILAQYADGLLVEAGGATDVHAIRRAQ